MQDSIKADEIALIWKKMNDAQKCLKQKNVHLALISFKEALEKRMSTAMLASDQRDLDKEIKSFQQVLFGSKVFRDTFGPVSFQDNEHETLLPFILQLIKVQDECVVESISTGFQPESAVSEVEVERRAQIIMDLLEKGDLPGARELLSRDDEVCVFVANTYNSVGIMSRLQKEFDKSIAAYMKALIALPDDEGLYYNIARARMEQGDWDEAIAAVKSALKINSQFKEGNDLLKYLNEKRKRIA